MKKNHPPETIQGRRVVLKKHNETLADLMFAYIDQDRERLKEFFPWVDQTQTPTDTLNYIHSTLENWKQYLQFDFGMYCKKTQRYMGNTGLVRLAWEHERCEMGYWIASSFEGQGFVSEAVQLLEETAFEMGFNRIEIRCAMHNARSFSIPQRNGYTLEGTLRQNEIIKGIRHDTCIFAKLRS